MRTALAAAAAALALSAGTAPSAAPADESPVAVTLALEERLCVAGKPLRVRVAVENRGRASLALHNALLFGAGLTARGADGTVRTASERNAPSGAQQPLLLPAGASLSALVDVAPLFPDLCAAPGTLQLDWTVAGVAAAPLALEVRRDWSGYGARLECDLGVIDLELFFAQAPATVANFLDLAEAGFYDGQSFHRVVKNFMVQGGCPNGDGSGDGPRQLRLEAGRGDGFPRHLRGTLSMAHKADPHSGSCQFFLCHRDQPALDGNYAAFGRIAKGLEVLDAIAEVPCALVPGGPDAGPSKPKQRVTIQRIRPLAPAAAGTDGGP
ncbi:MAG: peptidylprolyl isomerase [Planctomycetes bacterium]|nr:peptidylprolyl isomerase [Planctomycetota bacterium]